MPEVVQSLKKTDRKQHPIRMKIKYVERYTFLLNKAHAIPAIPTPVSNPSHLGVNSTLTKR